MRVMPISIIMVIVTIMIIAAVSACLLQNFKAKNSYISLLEEKMKLTVSLTEVQDNFLAL